MILNRENKQQSSEIVGANTKHCISLNISSLIVDEGMGWGRGVKIFITICHVLPNFLQRKQEIMDLHKNLFTLFKRSEIIYHYMYIFKTSALFTICLLNFEFLNYCDYYFVDSIVEL